MGGLLERKKEERNKTDTLYVIGMQDVECTIHAVICNTGQSKAEELPVIVGLYL